MTPSPFEADCNRKSEALSQYHDDRLRRETCGTCGVIRKFHYATGCAFRRIRAGREWAEWCGVEVPKEAPKDNYLREVIEATAPGPGGLTGLYRFLLECGHRESDILRGVDPKIPTTIKCALCASEDRKERKHEMGLFSKRPEAGGGTPAPAPGSTNGNYRSSSINTGDFNAPPPQPAPPPRTAPAPEPPRRFSTRRAEKVDCKLRFAISGPAGSGKTYTLLRLATELLTSMGLMAPGRIAMLDTEHESAEKYADEFVFDVVEGVTRFDPAIVPDLISDLAAQGYLVLIIDSWSHFWMGAGGELEQVDKIAARSKTGNSFAAWRDVSPKHTDMIDAILAAPMHVMVSMRVKTEWIVEKDERGKSVPRKIGLAPVMRDGVDYEFDIAGDIDQDNTLIISKSRCHKLHGEVIQKPGEKMARVLAEWLGSAPPAPARRAAAQPAPAASAPTTDTTDKPAPWRNMDDVKSCFADVRQRAGETQFGIEMAAAGWRNIQDIVNAMDSRDRETKAAARVKARNLYWRLDNMTEGK